MKRIDLERVLITEAGALERTPQEQQRWEIFEWVKSKWPDETIPIVLEMCAEIEAFVVGLDNGRFLRIGGERR